MFRWIRACCERILLRKQQRLLAEVRMLRRQIDESGVPLEIPPERRARLRELASRLSPETLKEINTIKPEEMAE